MTEFTAGVLRIIWLDEPPDPFPNYPGPGRVYPAQIVSIETRSEMLLRDLVRPALHGLVVRSPTGALSRIAGVESFATMALGTGQTGRIGILLVPVEER